MKLVDVLTLPSNIKERHEKLKNNIISYFKLYIENDNIILSCISNNKYNSKIIFLDITPIKPDSLIKIDCECKSFSFEFSYIINKNNGLIYPEKYLIDKVPKKLKNNLTACKHIITLAQFIYHRSTLIDNEIYRRLNVKQQ